jgi:PadR family transcriptional regulator, regulatory protein PadR
MKELTKIEEILLVAISRLKDQAYGVRIRQHVSGVLEKEFTYGNLYSALHQLTAKKLIRPVTGCSTPVRKGRPRIFYTITPEGREALRDAREMNARLWLGFPAFILDKGKLG